LGEAIKPALLQRAGLALKLRNVLRKASVRWACITVTQGWMMGMLDRLQKILKAAVVG
jgi:hypothetical protein